MVESDVQERASTAPSTIAMPLLRGLEERAGSLRSRNLGFGPRIATVVVLSLIAYGVGYAQVVSHALAGSGAAILVVAPLLAALIMTGYRAAPRGVGDAESDWIVAILVGAIGLGGIQLMTQRAPALAGLWGLPLLGAVLWFACCLTVLFGVRHVARMWPMWAFAVVSTTPLPFLLATAALGGTATAAGLVASAMGAVAVFLACRTHPMRRRVALTAASLGAAAILVLTASHALGLLLTVAFAAGLMPTVAVLAAAPLRRPLAPNAQDLTEVLPRRTALSVLVLAAVAVTLLLNSPPAAPATPLPSVSADWPQRAGLTDPEHLPVIARHFGPSATLVRYDVPARPGMPTAVVDVVSTTDRARLDDFDDAVFYPSPRPLDFRDADAGGTLPAGARIVYSNADATTDASGLNWYAVSWLWRTDSSYQRVTVLVNQQLGDQPPPAPQPLTLRETALRPVAWFARQQPDDHGQVDPRVTRRAAEVIALIAGPAGG